MIVIPMAGLSRRFTEAGYTVPKYMLPAHGRSVFAHAVGSFSAYFQSESFLFVVRDVANTPAFVRRECHDIGIADPEVIVLQNNTRGQAETVALGLSRASVPAMEPVVIFNIDTFRPNFAFPKFGQEQTDGYLEVFPGAGNNWSYVRPAQTNSDLVAETAEKHPISNLCCTGLYQFATAELFHTGYAEYARASAALIGQTELYVAPMYNVLIRHGCRIRYALIKPEAVIFCGVPAEYEYFRTTAAPPDASPLC
jgi:hypothetical protein